MLINWIMIIFYFFFVCYVYMYWKVKLILIFVLCVINGYKFNYFLLIKIVEMFLLKVVVGCYLYMNLGVLLFYLDV